MKNESEKKKESAITILDNKKCYKVTWERTKKYLNGQKKIIEYILKNTATISLRNGNNFVNIKKIIWITLPNNIW